MYPHSREALRSGNAPRTCTYQRIGVSILGISSSNVDTKKSWHVGTQSMGVSGPSVNRTSRPLHRFHVAGE